jgi:cytidylate kinase
MGVLAIDGPAGTGKSTVARAAADKLGLPYLDTGAMYRAVTAAALRAGLALDDETAIAALAQRCRLHVDRHSVQIDDLDVTVEIRGPAVTAAVSAVSAIPAVRHEMVLRQQAWVASQGGGILEGRDIGTVVFPDARLKVYLTASDEARASRRAAEGTAGHDHAAVAADLARRDRLDSTRPVSPLAAAADAVVVDTTDLDVGEVVERIVGLWNEREDTP